MVAYRNVLLVLIVLLVGFSLLGCAQSTQINEQTDEQTIKTDSWPDQTITLVTTGQVGGGMDLGMRAFGAALSRQLNVTVQYNNSPGSSGEIATNEVLRSKQDGNMLLVSNTAPLAFMYCLQKPFDKWEDQLSWLGTFAVESGFLVVSSESPWKNIETFLEAAKQQKMRVAVSNWASPETMVLLQIQEATGAQFEIIPMGGGEGMTAVLGGHIEALVVKTVRMETNKDSLKILAIFQDENQNPDSTQNAPPINDVVGTEVIEVASYRTVLVPTKVKEEYPNRYELLLNAFNRIIEDPEFVDDAKKYGFEGELVNWDPERSQKSFDNLVKSIKEYEEILK